jgi:hypothetical protein
MAKLQNGAILWQGASLIDGAPIVVIATGIKRKSQNAKTGAMIQTFIIRSDVSPVDALKSGADRSVCGDCPKRPLNFVAKFDGDQACYVDVAKSVRSVYAAFRRGIYPTVSPTAAAELFAGRKLRLGAYGNPSAAPYAMWEVVASKTAGRTGYIHNWRDANPAWSALVMASVENVQEGLAARRLGYRLFRVRSAAEPLMAREIACPASKEAGHKTSCFDCLACGGHSSKARVDIAIIAH